MVAGYQVRALIGTSMPDFGVLSSTQDMPTDGTQILDGTAPPTPGTGTVGAFYMDTVGKVLYGPKSASSLGPDEYAINPVTAPQYPNQNGNYTFGLRVKFLVAGVVTALRFYRASSAVTSSRTLTLYRAGVSVATVTSSGETGSGWKTFPLSAPVTIDTGIEYITAYRVPSDYFSETDAGGTPSYSPAHITNVGGCYTSGAAFPSTNVVYNYHADLVFNTGSPPWPTAIKSA